MHPRISLHQVAFIDESTTAFIDHCRSLGVANMTLVTPLLTEGSELQTAFNAVASGELAVPVLNHPLMQGSTLETDDGSASARLLRAVDTAQGLGSTLVYMQTGGRGALDWDAAASRFAELIAPGRDAAASRGITLLIENANPFNADIHMAHTFDDTIALATGAGIGTCVDLHGCWFEARLRERLRRAIPSIALVQISDYVLGDRSAPCRAVPGDGVIPYERLIGDLLEDGYEGLFDIELVGPRIRDEGARSATRRAADYVSDLLTRLGA